MFGPALIKHDSRKCEAHEPCSIVVHRTATEDAVMRRVRSEFREMPGMRLTLGQAMRLWDLDRPTCRAVLDTLVASHFLQQDPYGRYARAHGGY
jgi:hypothetical protein